MAESDQLTNRTADAAIERLAGGQEGVVARHQLIAAGVTARAVQHRLANGRLLVIYRGVYALGHANLTERARLFAALLAAGSGASLCRLSAAATWGLCGMPQVIDVLRAFNRRRGSLPLEGSAGSDVRRLRVHRTRYLPAEDVSEVRGISLTTVERTLLDIAGFGERSKVERLFSEACRLNLVDFGRLEAVLARGSGWRGTRFLASVVEGYEPAKGLTKSELEARFLDACRRRGLPMPLVNRRVRGFEVDFLWPSALLVVELDGFRFHADRAAFERDRERDLALKAGGFEVVRITHRMLSRDTDRVLLAIRERLEAALPFAA